METDESKNPLLIQIASGDKGKHCDIYPLGSIHKVIISSNKTCVLNEEDKVTDYIPDDFIIRKYKGGDTKTCPECSNKFPKNWPFFKDSCIRCFERLHINATIREEYREALRQEYLRDLNL